MTIQLDKQKLLEEMAVNRIKYIGTTINKESGKDAIRDTYCVGGDCGNKTVLYKSNSRNEFLPTTGKYQSGQYDANKDGSYLSYDQMTTINNNKPVKLNGLTPQTGWQQKFAINMNKDGKSTAVSYGNNSKDRAFENSRPFVKEAADHMNKLLSGNNLNHKKETRTVKEHNIRMKKWMSENKFK